MLARTRSQGVARERVERFVGSRHEVYARSSTREGRRLTPIGRSGREPLGLRAASLPPSICPTMNYREETSADDSAVKRYGPRKVGAGAIAASRCRRGETCDHALQQRHRSVVGFVSDLSTASALHGDRSHGRHQHRQSAGPRHNFELANLIISLTNSKRRVFKPPPRPRRSSCVSRDREGLPMRDTADVSWSTDVAGERLYRENYDAVMEK